MELTGERYHPRMKGIIELEHLSRYYFVVNQFDLRDKIVVDLASGEGYGSEILSRFAEKVYGFDISAEAIEHANKQYKKNNLNFAIADACNIPLEDKSIDIFVSFETIEHHDRHQEMLSEIKRVIKPDGVLIISSPDKKNYTDNTGYVNQYHVKELYYDEFKELLYENFKYNYFFLQNNFSGSMIIADFEEKKNCNSKIISSDELIPTPFKPLYNLAISSDNSEINIQLKNMAFGNFSVLTQEDIIQAQYEMQRTAEYKLGRKILKRIKFLRNYL